MTEVQDIDLSRFVPKEVDNTGITMATMDRFTSRNKTQPTEIDNGKKMSVIKMCSRTLLKIFTKQIGSASWCFFI